MNRPSIFVYHDYRTFLKDLFAFYKSKSKEFSVRKLAREAGVSVGYLSNILNSPQGISEKGLNKIVPHLSLTAAETSYLKLLRVIADSSNQQERIDALKRLQKFQNYQHEHPNEAHIFKYFTKWYHVAIREMAALPEFKLNPEWIQEKLNFSIAIGEIESAIKFLLDSGILKKNPDGSIKTPEQHIECHGEVYKICLTQFHKQIFNLASASIANTPREKRSIKSHTLPISESSFAKLQEILDKALQEVTNMGLKEKNPNSIYQVSFVGFPLTSVEGST